MSLLVMSLARSMSFGEVEGPWFGGSYILASLQETFFVREMRSKTSMVRGEGGGDFAVMDEKGIGMVSEEMREEDGLMGR